MLRSPELTALHDWLSSSAALVGSFRSKDLVKQCSLASYAGLSCCKLMFEKYFQSSSMTMAAFMDLPATSGD